MSWIEVPEVDQVGDFNLTQLGIDEAFLNITILASASANLNLSLYELSTNCLTCPFKLVKEGIGRHFQWKVNTLFPVKYRLRTRGLESTVPEINDNYKYCDLETPAPFGEFGIYNWSVEDRSSDGVSPICRVTTVLEPVNIYYPLLLALIFYILFLSSSYLIASIWSRKSSSKTENTSTVQQPSSSSFSQVPTCSSSTRSSGPAQGGTQHDGHGPEGRTERSDSTSSNNSSSEQELITSGYETQGQGQPLSGIKIKSLVGLGGGTTPSSGPRSRLRSLDTFRGICIVVMIFVNDGGGGYYFLEHATWDGLYIADLVFPWFLWIMGVCIPISLRAQLKRGGSSPLTLVGRIGVRALKLIGLGLLGNSVYGPVTVFGTGANLRFPGVLQRFGICYFVTGVLALISLMKAPTMKLDEERKLKAVIQDIGLLWISWIPVLLIVMIHCLITFVLPVPGCPTGYLGPGGLHQNNRNPGSCIGGAAGYLDKIIFGPSHLYQHPTAKGVYGSGAYDPEGSLGLLLSILQVWLGVQAGATLLTYPEPSSRLKRWGLWAIFTGILGGILCQFSQSDGWIPLNKNLWSLSYVLVTASLAFLLLSILYIVVDIQSWWSGSPFYEPGMNSILLYMGSEVLFRTLPWNWRIGTMSTHFSRLVETLWGTTLWVLIGIWLHCKKWYFSV